MKVTREERRRTRNGHGSVGKGAILLLPFLSTTSYMQLIIKPEDFASFYELFSWVGWFAMEPIQGFKSHREPEFTAKPWSLPRSGLCHLRSHANVI